MKKTISSIFATIALVLVFTAPGFVLAQANANIGAGTTGGATFVPLANYGNGTQFSNMFQSGSLSGYINAIFETCISLGAIAAVVRITYAGWLYMGNDIWGNKQKAKEIISDSVIGLLLLLSIYMILYQIDPNILNLNAVFTSFQTPAQQTPAQQLANGTQPL